MKLEQLLYIEGPRKHWALHNQQMTRINLHLSTITPNINGFGSSVKRHRLENRNTLFLLLRNTLNIKGGEKMEKGIQTNGTKKQTGLDIVMPEKTDFKPNLVGQDQNYFITI